MFGNNDMFSRLARAVTGEEIELLDKVHTQATLREDAKLASIRFDTFAELKDKRIITLDMECSNYGKVRLKRRQVFYAARAISTQDVNDMAYEDIKPINVVFVLAEHKYQYAIQKIGLTDLRTHEIYDDLMSVTVVYVKNVIKTYDEGQEAINSESNDNGHDSANAIVTTDMYTFARFFAISNQAEADQFSEEFGSTELGRELINMYEAAVSNTARLNDLSKSNYFTSRLTEAQLAYEREKAELRAELRAEQKMKERYILNSLKKLSPEVVADDLEVPLEQVYQIAAKQKTVY
jgi:hypothetical protein